MSNYEKQIINKPLEKMIRQYVKEVLHYNEVSRMYFYRSYEETRIEVYVKKTDNPLEPKREYWGHAVTFDLEDLIEFDYKEKGE